MAGIVTTLAGSFNHGYVDGQGSDARFHHLAGIAVDTTGTLYVGDTFNHRVRRISSTGECYRSFEFRYLQDDIKKP